MMMMMKKLSEGGKEDERKNNCKKSTLEERRKLKNSRPEVLTSPAYYKTRLQKPARRASLRVRPAQQFVSQTAHS